MASSGGAESWEPSARNADSSGTERFGDCRLRVCFGATAAGACLDPPQGRITLAFATPRCFVALPRQVKRVAWQDICAPPSAPSGEDSGCEGRPGGGAPRR